MRVCVGKRLEFVYRKVTVFQGCITNIGAAQALLCGKTHIQNQVDRKK
jgi:hypothetical protein